MKQTIDVLVEGGKASAGPPLGPQAGALGVNVSKVVEEINEKTRELQGMKVPVKVIVETEDKSFTIEVGTPPVSALIKKELKLDKASGEAGIKRVGDLSMEQARKIARTKFGNDDESSVNQVIGTCRSMGITVGQGEVTEEEKERYEQMEKEKEAEEAAKEAEKAEAAPEAGKGEEKKEEKPGEKPE